MAYKRSQARNRFESDVDTILQAVRIAHSNQCSVTVIREHVLCSAVVLCSARFEAYIEDLFGGWGAAIRAQGVTTERLPRTVRAFLLNQPSVVAAYRKFIVEEDEAHLLSRLEDLLAGTHYDLATDGIPLPAFSVASLYSDRKYPSPRNVKRLFNRFGFPNVFHVLNRVGKRDTEALLTSFNDLRTEMAHVGMPVGLSARDIKHRIKGLKIVVGCIDRTFYSHVCTSVGPACWT